MALATKVHDFTISVEKGLIKIVPLNDDAKKWIMVVILKPSGISNRLDFESVHVQTRDLEKILRKMMNYGFKVNLIRK